jgi:hypothetical protein
MSGSPRTERVFRGALQEVRWGILAAPDLDEAARDLSRRLRRRLVEEAQETAAPEGSRARIESLGVRRSQRIERPWYGLGILVRATVEATAKLRLVVDPEDSPAAVPAGHA